MHCPTPVNSCSMPHQANGPSQSLSTIARDIRANRSLEAITSAAHMAGRHAALASTGASTCSKRQPHRRKVGPRARGRPRAVEQQLRQIGEQGEALGWQGRARRRGRQQRQPLRRRAQRLRRHGGVLWGVRGARGFLGLTRVRRRTPGAVLSGRLARRVWRARSAPARRQHGQVPARGTPGGGAAAVVRGAKRRRRGAGREQRGCQRLQVLPAVEACRPSVLP